MKLAQALILRADTQKRIEQLKVRLLSNAKTQENESPSEDPKLLLKELDKLTSELFRLICSNSEIKILSTVDVSALQKQVDALSKEIRELEMKLQEANWSVDLVE